ncbi:LamB/YcsF family protein [Lacrimispora sp.]|uniref:LamB/YcsF family protein n=1 Tax=Lacrimispora sp. TaxID=2719234 RepID=UPI002FD9D490
MYKVDLNSDLGESFGRYTLEANEEIIKHVSSANIACGFHAGDPMVMRHTVEMAVKYGTGIGAHPGYPDLQGFGRRKMSLSYDEIKNVVTYQLGAVYAFAKAAGKPVAHISAHGALGNLVQEDAVAAKALCQACCEFDTEMRILYYGKNSVLKKEADRFGLPTVSMVFADRAYLEDGNLVPRSQPGAMIEDKDEAIGRVIRMIKEGKVTAVTGKDIEVKAETVLVHGDGDHALEFVLALKEAFGKEGIEISCFSK